MAKTVEHAFDLLLARLRGSRSETAAAKRHRASIEAKLKSQFGMTAFFRTGSFGSGTNVSGFSDVDYFAVIPAIRLKENSAATLSEVANALRARFATTDGIRINGPAVRLPFGLDGAQATEVVPVDELGETKLGYRRFDMPDRKGGWMFAAPESHNAYVAEQDRRLSGKLKPLIRFVKLWKYARKIPVSSFYLEMRTTAYAATESSIVYDIDLARLFALMHDERLSPIRDPRFENSAPPIEAVSTDIQRKLAVNALACAADRAEDARKYSESDRLAAAFDRWNLVFNDRFPKRTI